MKGRKGGETSGMGAAQNRFPWPPVVFGASAALAVLLHVAWPLPWFGTPFADFLFAVGLLLGLAAAVLAVAALRALRGAGTTVLHRRAVDHLVTGGPFALSRNPIYLAAALLMTAAALVLGIAWFLPAAVLAGFVTHLLSISHEERHLADRFGKRYRDYQKRVRRWI